MIIKRMRITQFNIPEVERNQPNDGAFFLSLSFSSIAGNDCPTSVVNIVPQLEQKRASGGLSCPQVLHCINYLPSGLS